MQASAAGVGGLVVHLPTTGRMWVSQDGRTARLGPGDFALVDDQRPFEVGSPGDSRPVAVAFPRVGTSAALVPPPTAVRIDGSRGAGAIASSVIRTLAAQGPAIDPETVGPLRELVVGMISVAARGVVVGDPVARRSPPAPSRGLAETVRAEIERSLSDPGLSRATVAARLAISPSYLDRLLAAGDTSFGRFLLEARLRRCHAELVGSTAGGRRIGEIAAGAGLRDPSYFARVYKRRYGMTPLQTRERSRTETVEAVHAEA